MAKNGVTIFTSRGFTASAARTESGSTAQQIRIDTHLEKLPYRRGKKDEFRLVAILSNWFATTELQRRLFSILPGYASLVFSL
ncbi:hypothetical protein EYR41_002664 [Orbilia oligospora]|uniref:Uncharacterized protein n=1 Tax=Orbilia oligospora TaxID=2813651 RepID=A0A7C8JXB0_ORBOL|nr:hypothetical protein TWF751_002107 [Orbilia oligospora]TGJ70629.1 hypothetical protein EYR41_002664 [Orbilia oligospora]